MSGELENQLEESLIVPIIVWVVVSLIIVVKLTLVANHKRETAWKGVRGVIQSRTRQLAALRPYRMTASRPWDGAIACQHSVMGPTDCTPQLPHNSVTYLKVIVVFIVFFVLHILRWLVLVICLICGSRSVCLSITLLVHLHLHLCKTIKAGYTWKT